MNNSELCVPASAVGAYDDGADSAVLPTAGDQVEVTIGGRVSRVEGQNVYLMPETANGEPIPNKMGGEPEAPAGDTEATMDDLMEQEGAGAY